MLAQEIEGAEGKPACPREHWGAHSAKTRRGKFQSGLAVCRPYGARCSTRTRPHRSRGGLRFFVPGGTGSPRPAPFPFSPLRLPRPSFFFYLPDRPPLPFPPFFPPAPAFPG